MITLVGDPFGNSFTMDDLFVNTLYTQATAVPEPGTLSLLLLGASVLGRTEESARGPTDEWGVAS